MDPAEAIEAAALARQQPMLAAMAQGESEVQRFYKNCTVFLTGGSGFLGKQLIEKLLRSCAISKVYMLLRPKKDKNINDRLKDILSNEVFDNLRVKQPTFMDKIKAINGDVSELRLGIKDEDWNTLTEEVDVIFHVAATIRFDEALRTATFINVRGTREAILLGKDCKRLKSFVHVSTAYSHATYDLVKGNVEEKFYRAPVPPETMISMAESVDADRLDRITNDLMSGWPNTYTFTKAIAEEEVRTSSSGLPICIVRPAVVLGTRREPGVGWVDTSCLFGVTGLIFGAGLGVLHTCFLDKNVTIGFIPCDYVNNAIIVAARETATNQAKGGDDTKIYTVCSTHRNPIKFETLTSTMENEGRQKIASPKMVYYGFSLYTTNMQLFTLASLFLHVIPAYIADFICLIMGKERRFVKLVNKLYKMFTTVSYFTINEWDFIDNNLEKLYSGLSEQDRAIFNFDVTDIEWRNMVMLILIGLRRYIVKDGLKNTAYGIKKQKYLAIVNFFFMSFYAYCVWKVMYFMFCLIKRMDPAEAIEAAALARQQPMLAAMAQGESEVQRFYKNCTIFLTGGSGFLGKQLIEKLLRSCTVSKVYMLLRSKKGKHINDRLKDVLSNEVFDHLRKKQPTFMNKIKAINGDVSELRLGIKDDDWNTLTEEVDVIFHVAATTRFDEALQSATFINVRGTREAILLGKDCKKLKSFVHVSTAYSHATYDLVKGDVEEKFYRAPVPPETMISMAESVEADRLDRITNDFMSGWPNTYTFTKAIAEEQVRTSSSGLPICIVRPAVVTSTRHEPAPGWVDTSSLFGFTGIIFGACLGVLHTCFLDRNVTVGTIPCDYVNNAIIVAAKETATNQTKGGDDTKIYTVCSTHRNPVTYGALTGTIENDGRRITSPKIVYYGFSFYTTNMQLFTLASLFLHVIPAYIADFVCLLMGKERRFVKLVNKLYKMFTTVSYFTINEWDFIDNNLEKLYSGLSEQDRAIFNFDVTDIEWRNMAILILIGLRRYIFKDGLKNTAYGLKKQKYLGIANYFFMFFYAYCVWKVMYFMFYLVSSIVSFIFIIKC